MKHNIASLFLVCASFVVAPLVSSAAPITVPTGLNPGDQYRLVFVTSTTRDATSSDIEDYNAFVTSVANSVPELAALGTTWHAIGSTVDVSARDNTGTNPASTGVPIYRLDNIRLANNNPDLWDSFLENTLNVTEQGMPILAVAPPGSTAWTGSFSNGTAAAQPLGSGNPIAGDALATNFTWMLLGNGPAVDARRLYGISEQLTVPIPEPSTLALGLAGLAGLIAFQWLRRRSQ